MGLNFKNLISYSLLALMSYDINRFFKNLKWISLTYNLKHNVNRYNKMYISIRIKTFYQDARKKYSVIFWIVN